MGANNFTVMIMGIAKAGMEIYVSRILKHMMESSRGDGGCIVYNIHQSNLNPLEFMVYMLWDSQEAFERHNNKPEMLEFRKKLADQLFDTQTPKTYWHLID